MFDFTKIKNFFKTESSAQVPTKIDKNDSGAPSINPPPVDPNDSHPHHDSPPEELKYASQLSRIMRGLSTLRMASYASDVGEATRGALPKFFVNSMYAVTFGYIGTDLFFKYSDNKHLKNLPSEDGSILTPFQKYMAYHTLWHAQASLLLPTFTIHTIVGSVRKATKDVKWINPSVLRFVPAGVALASIPFLIHPLDKLADIVMELSYCKLLDFKPEEKDH